VLALLAANRSDAAPSPLGDEAALLARVRAGDQRALSEIFRATHPALCAFATGFVRSRDVAEEIVQDAFVTVWANRERWEVHTSLRSYLYTVVRNYALRYLRRERLHQRWAADAAATLNLSTALALRETSIAETRLRVRDLRAALARAINALPLRRREAFTLRWEHHLSYAEIAGIMGIAESTVQIHMTKAVEALHGALEKMLRADY
jgi:RNA polymerase sigma-70 factor, ECF subfamily